jgi:hypothetical protein
MPLASVVHGGYFRIMSTLAEIEAAIEKLPAIEREKLFAFLAGRIEKPASVESTDDDPFAAIIGAYAGNREATGRKAEDILYGRGA